MTSKRTQICGGIGQTAIYRKIRQRDIDAPNSKRAEGEYKHDYW